MYGGKRQLEPSTLRLHYSFLWERSDRVVYGRLCVWESMGVVSIDSSLCLSVIDAQKEGECVKVSPAIINFIVSPKNESSNTRNECLLSIRHFCLSVCVVRLGSAHNVSSKVD